MRNPATIPSAGATDTITIAPGLRIQFLANFTRKNRGAFQMFKLAWPSYGIVCRPADTAPTFWFWLHAVGESNAPAFS